MAAAAAAAARLGALLARFLKNWPRARSVGVPAADVSSGRSASDPWTAAAPPPLHGLSGGAAARCMQKNAP